LGNLLSSAIITGSRERQEHYSRHNFFAEKKLRRVPFGVDVERFRRVATVREDVRRELDIREPTYVLGAVGHFGLEKGLDVVIRAFQDLRVRMKTSRLLLVVVGDGTPDQRARINSLITKTDDGSIKLVGYRSDVERYFSAFDLFVHAPRLEAFGLVLLEAMAAGLPVIATRTGGIVDLVNEDVGRLVPIESPASLAEACEEFLRIPDLLVRCGLAARRRVEEQFTLRAYVERHVGEYRAASERTSVGPALNDVAPPPVRAM
jgi:glycosyltransferase involved in cell wall biosynthesis